MAQEVSAAASPGGAASGSPSAHGGRPASPLELSATASTTSFGGSSDAQGGSQGPHPNLFCRGMPRAWGEGDVAAVFGRFGQVTSVRVARDAATKASLGYGFVRFAQGGEAQAAVTALDGAQLPEGHTLQVKAADRDAGPTPPASGLNPSDLCYVKHLPAHFTVQDVEQLFAPYGPVQEVKLFPCLDQLRGACSIVRMAATTDALAAVQALNNSSPAGAPQSLVVRFAETPEEKAERQRRREATALQRLQGTGGCPPPSDAAPAASAATSGLAPPVCMAPPMCVPPSMGLPPAAELQRALAALGLGGSNATTPSLMSPVPASPAPSMSCQPASICVQGLPPEAGRLWLYEHFARFGAVTAARVQHDPATGLPLGYVFFGEAGAAEAAQRALDGMQASNRFLQITVQPGGHGHGHGTPPQAHSPAGHLGSPYFGSNSAVNAAVLAAVGLAPSQPGWPIMPQQQAGGAGGMRW